MTKPFRHREHYRGYIISVMIYCTVFKVTIGVSKDSVNERVSDSLVGWAQKPIIIKEDK